MPITFPTLPQLPFSRPVAPAAKPAAPQAPGRVAPPADTLQLSEAAAMRKAGEVRLTAGQDALTVTVAPGETLWRIASRFGAQGQTKAYAQAIREANGMAGDALKAGQTLRLPYHAEAAGLTLLVAMAVSKDLAVRGKAAPKLDVKAVAVNPGPLDSYLVTVPRQDGKGLQHYAVFDDQTGEDPTKWTLQPLSKTEYEKRQQGDLGE